MSRRVYRGNMPEGPRHRRMVITAANADFMPVTNHDPDLCLMGICPRHAAFGYAEHAAQHRGERPGFDESGA